MPATLGPADVFGFAAPSYCHHCGLAFPWTTARLDAAKELTDTFDELTEEERQQLQQSLEDLTRDTPSAKLAESKFKRLIKSEQARRTQPKARRVDPSFCWLLLRDKHPIPQAWR